MANGGWGERWKGGRGGVKWMGEETGRGTYNRFLELGPNDLQNEPTKFLL